MRAVPRPWAGVLPRGRAGRRGERAAPASAGTGAAGYPAGDDVANVDLVLGGVRSGKSRFAEERASGLGGENVLYVATAVLSGRDADLAQRVEEHRARRPAGWTTLELSGGELGRVVEAAGGYGAVLLDSLTLWISTRMIRGGQEGTLEELNRLLEGMEASGTPLILVSDEVGFGGVAGNAEMRAFADLLGLANQRVAAVADEVYLCVAGLPVKIK